jgi:hypothetical protein
MKKNSFTEMFYKNAGYIVVVLISLVYVASSLINISKSGKTVYEIIGAGVLSLIVGIIINGVFRSIGLRRGDEDERTVATILLHGQTVDEITPDIDKLDEFCQRENQRALREIRTRILASQGMKYSDMFDSDGCAQPVKINGKLRKRAYKKALKVKIKPLVSSNLTSDGVKANDPFDFGTSKKEYSSHRSAGDVLIKLVMAIIFGYFGVSLASEINVASVIWNGLQIILYVAGGVIQMYSSYMWVVDDYRQGIIKKIDYLQKFKKFALSSLN